MSPCRGRGLGRPSSVGRDRRIPSYRNIDAKRDGWAASHRVRLSRRLSLSELHVLGGKGVVDPVGLGGGVLNNCIPHLLTEAAVDAGVFQRV